MFPRFNNKLESFKNTLQSIKSNALPSLLSAGTVFSSAGSSLFGTMKILDYIYGYQYENEEDQPDYLDTVRLASYLLVIACNVVIITDTRIPAIFREYRKSVSKPITEEEPPEAHEDDLTRIFEEGSNYALTQDIKPDNTYVIKIVDRLPVHGHANQPTHNIVSVRSVPDNEIQALNATEDKKSFAYHFTKKSISGTLKFLGMSSNSFASLNTFLGSITLFEFMGAMAAEIKFPGSTYTVICKFYSSYSYVYPATKKNSDKLAKWIMGEKDPLEDPNDATTRLQDVKKWLTTIGLSFLNIISSPFLAFWSTMQTLYKIPGVRDYDTFILYFAAVSTVSSLSNEIISKSPSVHRAFEAWRNGKEDGSEQIRAIDEANITLLNYLNRMVVLAGIVDSIATGANIVVSVINTSTRISDVERYNPYLFSFSVACGISAMIVNYAFSVRRGHRDFLKHEMYPFLAQHNFLKAVEAIHPLPAIEVTKHTLIVKRSSKEREYIHKAEVSDESLKVSLLHPENHDINSGSPSSPTPYSVNNLFSQRKNSHVPKPVEIIEKKYVPTSNALVF